MKGSLLEQLKTHKTDVMVGAAGIVVTAALYMRSRKKTTAAATSPGAAPATAATVVTPGYVAQPGTTIATTSGTDAYNGMENQILGLQTSGASTKTPAPTSGASTKTPAAAALSWTPQGQLLTGGKPKRSSPALQPTEGLQTQVLHGTGFSATKNYGAGVVAGATGGDWSTISTWTATIADINAGDTVGYESALGAFTPITSVTQYKALEHTKHGAQTTTWVKP